MRCNVLHFGAVADGFTFRRVRVLGTEKTAMPRESDITVENGTPVVEDCDFVLKKKSEDKT